MSAIIRKGSAVKPAALLSLILSPCELYAAEVFNKEDKRIEFIGEINGHHQFSSDPDEKGDETYARFSLLGELPLSDSLSGYGLFEYNVQGNTVEENNDSSVWLAYAGVKGESGLSLDYGRNEGLIYDTAAWTDVLPVFGNDTYTEEDNFMAGRASNVLTLRVTDALGKLEGLDFAIQYQGQNAGSRELMQQNGEGLGYSVSYETEYGLSVAAAFIRSGRTDEQKRLTQNQSEKAEAWATSLKYDDSTLYLAVSWGETHNLTALDDGAVAQKTKNLEIVGQYQFESGFRPSIAWLQSVAYTSEHSRFDRVKYLDLALFYDLNEHFTLYVDHKINRLNGGSDAVRAHELSSANVTATGMVYHF
ncbi:TPA: porin [Enterobacter cloacae]